MRVSEPRWAERTRVSSVGLTRRRRSLHSRSKSETRLLFFLAVCAGHGDYCCAYKSSPYNTWFLYVGDIGSLSTGVVDRNKCEAIIVIAITAYRATADCSAIAALYIHLHVVRSQYLQLVC